MSTPTETTQASEDRRSNPPSPASSTWARVLAHSARLGILVPFLALFLVLAVLSRAFLSPPNLLNLFDQQATILIVAAAGTLVMISGGVDLSIGAVYSLAGLVAARLTTDLNLDARAAILLAVLSGALVGVVNGLLVTLARIPPLIATLATSYAVAGLATVTAGGTVLLVHDEHFLVLGSAAVGPLMLTSVLALLVIAATWILLELTSYGRALFAVGGNEEAARLSGIRTGVVKLVAYSLSGAAAAFAGVIIASRVGSGQANPGIQTSLVFTVLAGIVIGGTSLLGGEGAVWRTCIGILFLALITNGFVLLSLDSVYEQIIEGLLIVVAVTVDVQRRLRAR